MLDMITARKIINHLGSSGTPIERGIKYFTVGLDVYTDVLKEEYFEFIKDGLSTFKLVIGSYGGGKTHFLLTVKNIAFSYNSVVSYVVLNPRECPFDKLELVYKAIVANIEAPPFNDIPSEKGMEAFIRIWFERKMKEFEVIGDSDKMNDIVLSYLGAISGVESISFRNAMIGAFLALYKKNEEDFYNILSYLTGEGWNKETLKQFNIFEPIDKTNAFKMIRSLSQFVRSIGYSGMVFLFDEAERMVSLASTKNHRVAMDNLRQFIDECGASNMEGVFFFYAVPTDEVLFGTSEGAMYEALKQRLKGVFNKLNPTGVRIDLENLNISPHEFLRELAEKLAMIYETAYNFKFDKKILKKAIDMFGKLAYKSRYIETSYRRLFIKSIIQAFHHIRKNDLSILKEDSALNLVSSITSGSSTEDSTDFDEEF